MILWKLSLRRQDTGMKMFNFSRNFSGNYSAIFLLESEYTGIENENFELIILFHFVDQNIYYVKWEYMLTNAVDR